MIIRISGLPGSGKTTLGLMLSEALKYKLFRIDEYRNKHKDEFKALVHLFQDIKEQQDDFILDSAGFNRRVLWVFQFLKTRTVDVKLICDKEILKERIKQKSVPKDEYYPYTDTRDQYIDDYFEDMAHKLSDIEINTSHLTKMAALRCALSNLNFYTPQEQNIFFLIEIGSNIACVDCGKHMGKVDEKKFIEFNNLTQLERDARSEYYDNQMVLLEQCGCIAKEPDFL